MNVNGKQINNVINGVAKPRNEDGMILLKNLKSGAAIAMPNTAGKKVEVYVAFTTYPNKLISIPWIAG